MVIAFLRISHSKVLVFVAISYIEVIRNVPLLIQIFFFYFGLPSLGIQIDSFMAGVLGLIVYTAAFIAETIRAGIQSIPKGQWEAARGSGLNYLQMMRYIILPQAIKIVIPAIANQFISLVKNSAVLAVIAGMDLMYRADLIASETFRIFETYILVAMFYFLLIFPLTILANWLERRFKVA